MNTRLDVIGIGNAMVDAIISSTKEDVLKNGMIRDSMNLIDEKVKKNLHDKYIIKRMIGGGSLGNSMFGITSFGGNGSFIGKIKEDKIGNYLQQDMIQEGLRFPLGFSSPNISTGCCTIFVEEDGTRTMCTYLGAGTLISTEDIKEEDVKNHQIAYLEGYLWDNEKDKKAMKKMVDICKADHQKIAFTLSDLFCVDRHRDSFKELIANDVDILFGNQDEFSAMVNSRNLDDGIAYAKSLNNLSLLTLAEKGSLIIANNEVIEIASESVNNVVDTTGAGDLYAAGFLYGLTHQKNYQESGHLASIASAEIISHFGARPKVKLSSLI